MREVAHCFATRNHERQSVLVRMHVRRRSQRARARLVKQVAALLSLADRLAQAEQVDWPAP